MTELVTQRNLLEEIDEVEIDDEPSVNSKNHAKSLQSESLSETTSSFHEPNYEPTLATTIVDANHEQIESHVVGQEISLKQAHHQHDSQEQQAQAQTNPSESEPILVNKFPSQTESNLPSTVVEMVKVKNEAQETQTNSQEGRPKTPLPRDSTLSQQPMSPMRENLAVPKGTPSIDVPLPSSSIILSKVKSEENIKPIPVVEEEEVDVLTSDEDSNPPSLSTSLQDSTNKIEASTTLKKPKKISENSKNGNAVPMHTVSKTKENVSSTHIDLQDNSHANFHSQIHPPQPMSQTGRQSSSTQVTSEVRRKIDGLENDVNMVRRQLHNKICC